MALISPEDKHHADATRLLDTLQGELRISPYSLVELDLLLRSGEIIVKDVIAFYDALSDLFEYREIGTFSTRPEYHREAYELRKKYENLTYFDSLHASVGIIEDIELVSYDKEYAITTELKYDSPSKYIT